MEEAHTEIDADRDTSTGETYTSIGLQHPKFTPLLSFNLFSYRLKVYAVLELQASEETDNIYPEGCFATL